MLSISGWIIAFFAFWGIEAVFGPFTSVWFAFGAAGGFAGCLLGLPKEGQLALFLLSALCALFLIRPLSFLVYRKGGGGHSAAD